MKPSISRYSALADIEEGKRLLEPLCNTHVWILPASSRLEVSLEQVDMWILSGRDTEGLGLAWLHICTSKLNR